MDYLSYVPDHFKPHEVFPPEMDDLFDKSHLWTYINPMVLITMDRLRERYGTAIMNTWGLSQESQKRYGIHYFRGWRTRDCDIGAQLSQHKMGCAADMAFVHVSAEKIREDILTQPYDTTFDLITCIEMEVSWLHFDVRPWDKANKGILKVYP